MISEKYYKSYDCTRNYTREEVKDTFNNIKNGLTKALKHIQEIWAEFGDLGDDTDNCRNLAALYSSVDLGIDDIVDGIKEELKKPYLNMGE